ncbi:MAG: lysophospholipid acyltransferase family protein [Bacteroidota bacterium]
MKESCYPLAFKLKKLFTKSLLFLTGIRCSVKKEADLKSDVPYVFCANHTSYFDIVLSYRIIPYFFLSMGKYELSKVPIFNIFFKKMNILVDRGSKISSHRAFIRAGQEIEKGYSIVLFPEGGILRRSIPELHRFKNGPFKLAIEKQVPIVPITFLNNWKIFPHGDDIKKYGGPAVAHAVIHKPIETKGMSDEDMVDLREHVFNIIDKTLKENE